MEGEMLLWSEFPVCMFQFHLPALWACIQIVCPVREVLREAVRIFRGDGGWSLAVC